MRTERGFSRVVGFSDGVVAIAITLLVLPLVTTAAQHQSDVWTFLADNASDLFLFALSFVVIGRFWLVHHQIYENAVGYTPALVWANLLWLLSIVFLPVPTQLIASAEREERITYALYVGTMLVTCFAALLQLAIIRGRPDLQAPEVRGTLRLAPSWIVIAIMSVALLSAVLFLRAGLFALLLLALSPVLDRSLARRG
ncbi:MAG TPA: TMEM175 family protein [Rhodoglobus sp.]|nr:TMEM175 family protein [Rhodoglobus sp.]